MPRTDRHLLGALVTRLVRGRLYRAALVICLLGLSASTVFAADKGSPLPRFATLRADEVNLRTGPGERYPIEWVFTRKGMPVEIVAEYDVWRKIRDWQGTEGWVHQRMIAANRAVIVRGDTRPLYGDADAKSPVVARAEPGVIARLLECQGPWCRVESQNIRGWLRRSEIWGVYPDEDVR